ncbi:MAG: hypothetical protein EXS63_09885, partial [Candidatus Omnitrophica bacterium]|nr:hypothetical protein [Candidatus Omnitrophota bacterium]
MTSYTNEGVLFGKALMDQSLHAIGFQKVDGSLVFRDDQNTLQPIELTAGTQWKSAVAKLLGLLPHDPKLPDTFAVKDSNGNSKMLKVIPGQSIANSEDYSPQELARANAIVEYFKKTLTRDTFELYDGDKPTGQKGFIVKEHFILDKETKEGAYAMLLRQDAKSDPTFYNFTANGEKDSLAFASQAWQAAAKTLAGHITNGKDTGVKFIRQGAQFSKMPFNPSADDVAVAAAILNLTSTSALLVLIGDTSYFPIFTTNGKSLIGLLRPEAQDADNKSIPSATWILNADHKTVVSMDQLLTGGVTAKQFKEQTGRQFADKLISEMGLSLSDVIMSISTNPESLGSLQGLIPVSKLKDKSIRVGFTGTDKDTEIRYVSISKLLAGGIIQADEKLVISSTSGNGDHYQAMLGFSIPPHLLPIFGNENILDQMKQTYAGKYGKEAVMDLRTRDGFIKAVHAWRDTVAETGNGLAILQEFATILGKAIGMDRYQVDAFVRGAPLSFDIEAFRASRSKIVRVSPNDSSEERSDKQRLQMGPTNVIVDLMLKNTNISDRSTPGMLSKNSSAYSETYVAAGLYAPGKNWVPGKEALAIIHSDMLHSYAGKITVDSLDSALTNYFNMMDDPATKSDVETVTGHLLFGETGKNFSAGSYIFNIGVGKEAGANIVRAIALSLQNTQGMGFTGDSLGRALEDSGVFKKELGSHLAIEKATGYSLSVSLGGDAALLNTFNVREVSTFGQLNKDQQNSILNMPIRFREINAVERFMSSSEFSQVQGDRDQLIQKLAAVSGLKEDEIKIIVKAHPETNFTFTDEFRRGGPSNYHFMQTDIVSRLKSAGTIGNPALKGAIGDLKDVEIRIGAFTFSDQNEGGISMTIPVHLVDAGKDQPWKSPSWTQSNLAQSVAFLQVDTDYQAGLLSTTGKKIGSWFGQDWFNPNEAVHIAKYSDKDQFLEGAIKMADGFAGAYANITYGLGEKAHTVSSMRAVTDSIDTQAFLLPGNQLSISGDFAHGFWTTAKNAFDPVSALSVNQSMTFSRMNGMQMNHLSDAGLEGAQEFGKWVGPAGYVSFLADSFENGSWFGWRGLAILSVIAIVAPLAVGGVVAVGGGGTFLTSTATFFYAGSVGTLTGLTGLGFWGVAAAIGAASYGAGSAYYGFAYRHELLNPKTIDQTLRDLATPLKVLGVLSDLALWYIPGRIGMALAEKAVARAALSLPAVKAGLQGGTEAIGGASNVAQKLTIWDRIFSVNVVVRTEAEANALTAAGIVMRTVPVTLGSAPWMGIATGGKAASILWRAGFGVRSLAPIYTLGASFFNISIAFPISMHGVLSFVSLFPGTHVTTESVMLDQKGILKDIRLMFSGTVSTSAFGQILQSFESPTQFLFLAVFGPLRIIPSLFSGILGLGISTVAQKIGWNGFVAKLFNQSVSQSASVMGASAVTNAAAGAAGGIGGVGVATVFAQIPSAIRWMVKQGGRLSEGQAIKGTFDELIKENILQHTFLLSWLPPDLQEIGVEFFDISHPYTFHFRAQANQFNQALSQIYSTHQSMSHAEAQRTYGNNAAASAVSYELQAAMNATDLQARQIHTQNALNLMLQNSAAALPGIFGNLQTAIRILENPSQNFANALMNQVAVVPLNLVTPATPSGWVSSLIRDRSLNFSSDVTLQTLTESFTKLVNTWLRTGAGKGTAEYLAVEAEAIRIESHVKLLAIQSQSSRTEMITALSDANLLISSKPGDLMALHAALAQVAQLADSIGIRGAANQAIQSSVVVIQTQFSRSLGNAA